LALTTRPSQPSEGRTAAVVAVATPPHPFERAERHEEGVGAGETDYLAGDVGRGAGLDHHAGTDRHGVDRPSQLDHQAAHADDAALDLDAVEFADLVG